MPKIIKKADKDILQVLPGLHVESITEMQNHDSHVMEVKRLIFGPAASGPEFIHGDIDQLIYVIKGDGIAKVNNNELMLEIESVLWLETGEKCQLIAGSTGMEILQGSAPRFSA